MVHSIVPARFDPRRSAYWLSPSGQEAASRLSTDWFWALRATLGDRESAAPGMLFLVTSDPSPYPIPNPSLTLGPRQAQDTGTIQGSDADLLVRDGPLPSLERDIHKPLYVHTVPALRIHFYCCPPLTSHYYHLEQESLRRFKSSAEENQRIAAEYRKKALATLGFEAVKNTWAAPTRDAGSLRFGQGLNDPHAYVFDFDAPSTTPALDKSAAVYNEVMLYVQ